MITPRNPIEWTTLGLLGIAVLLPQASASPHRQTPPLLCAHQDRFEPCEGTQKLEKPKVQKAVKPKTDRSEGEFKARKVEGR